MNPRLIEKIIASCKKCIFIDKPPCIYHVYKRFLPGIVKVLVVSESPPPGNKSDYLYNLDHSDRLRKVLARIFNIPSTEVINYLVKNNIFWTTAVKCRPISKKYIEIMRRNCLYILDLEIKELKPRKIIALGTIARKSVNELRIENIPIEKHYHPLYLARFHKNNLQSLRSLILGD